MRSSQGWLGLLVATAGRLASSAGGLGNADAQVTFIPLRLFNGGPATPVLVGPPSLLIQAGDGYFDGFAARNTAFKVDSAGRIIHLHSFPGVPADGSHLDLTFAGW